MPARPGCANVLALLSCLLARGLRARRDPAGSGPPPGARARAARPSTPSLLARDPRRRVRAARPHGPLELRLLPGEHRPAARGAERLRHRRPARGSPSSATPTPRTSGPTGRRGASGWWTSTTSISPATAPTSATCGGWPWGCGWPPTWPTWAGAPAREPSRRCARATWPSCRPWPVAAGPWRCGWRPPSAATWPRCSPTPTPPDFPAGATPEERSLVEAALRGLSRPRLSARAARPPAAFCPQGGGPGQRRHRQPAAAALPGAGRGAHARARRRLDPRAQGVRAAGPAGRRAGAPAARDPGVSRRRSPARLGQRRRPDLPGAGGGTRPASALGRADQQAGAGARPGGRRTCATWPSSAAACWPAATPARAPPMASPAWRALTAAVGDGRGPHPRRPSPSPPAPPPPSRPTATTCAPCSRSEAPCWAGGPGRSNQTVSKSRPGETIQASRQGSPSSGARLQGGDGPLAEPGRIRAQAQRRAPALRPSRGCARPGPSPGPSARPGPAPPRPRPARRPARRGPAPPRSRSPRPAARPSAPPAPAGWWRSPRAPAASSPRARNGETPRRPSPVSPRAPSPSGWLSSAFPCRIR